MNELVHTHKSVLVIKDTIFGWNMMFLSSVFRLHTTNASELGYQPSISVYIHNKFLYTK